MAPHVLHCALDTGVPMVRGGGGDIPAAMTQAKRMPQDFTRCVARVVGPDKDFSKFDSKFHAKFFEKFA